jgi:excisionase family DNA binding protein
MPLTTTQAAEKLGITPARVGQLIAAGRIKATPFGRSHLIEDRDLAKYTPRKTGRPRKIRMPQAG